MLRISEMSMCSVALANIEARIKQEPAIKPSTFVERMRERFAGVFGTPRFSPAFGVALVLLTVGVTAVVMNYIGSRSAGPQIAQNSEPQTQPEPATKNVETAPDVRKEGASPDGGDQKGPATASQRGTKLLRNVTTPSARPTPERVLRGSRTEYVQAIAISRAM